MYLLYTVNMPCSFSIRSQWSFVTSSLIFSLCQERKQFFIFHGKVRKRFLWKHLSKVLPETFTFSKYPVALFSCDRKKKYNRPYSSYVDSSDCYLKACCGKSLFVYQDLANIDLLPEACTFSCRFQIHKIRLL